MKRKQILLKKDIVAFLAAYGTRQIREIEQARMERERNGEKEIKAPDASSSEEEWNAWLKDCPF